MRRDSGRLTSSRRNFLRFAAMGVAAPILTEGHLARAARLVADDGTRPVPAPMIPALLPANAVLIDANENPMGPCQAAREKISQLTPYGGRYDLYGETAKLIKTFAAQHSLKEDHVAVYAGSSEPLYFTVLAFASPKRSLVIADPSYEWAMMAAAAIGAPIHKVPLTAEYAHDVKAMVGADPNAGVLYICNPNNPTGTLTSKADIVWALENKPKGSVLLVDEAYIHFTDEADVIDLVAADKDIVVLRTFSKVYGMAGLRSGFALARPDLLAKLRQFGENFMPIMGSGPANASLEDAQVVPMRKKIIGDTRRETIAWLREKSYKVIGDSQSNCFMIDTGRDGRGVMAAMRQKDIYIGRTWPVWPNAVRITVGTPEEMVKFRTAFKEVMDAPPVTATAERRRGPRDGDGISRFA